MIVRTVLHLRLEGCLCPLPLGLASVFPTRVGVVLAKLQRRGVPVPEGWEGNAMPLPDLMPNNPLQVRSVSLKPRPHKTMGDRELRSVDL